MTLVFEKAHFAFPPEGLTNNYMTVPAGLIGLTNPEVDVRVEVQRPPLPLAGAGNQVYTAAQAPFYFYFLSNRVDAYLIFTTGGASAVSFNYAGVTDLPDVLEDIQLRQTWDPVTQTHSVYWRASGAGLGNDGGWKLGGSTVRAGNTLAATAANWVLAGNVGNNCTRGKAYRWYKKLNGVVDFDLWAERDITREFTGTQDSITPGIGPAVTVFRQPNIDRLAFDGTAGDTWTFPDAANLDITGDICIIIGIRPNLGTTLGVGGKWSNTGNQRSYRVEIQSDGRVGFVWSTTGADAITVNSSSAVYSDQQLLYCAIVVDADNGSGQRIIRFYTSPDHPDLWNWTLHSTIGPTAGVVAMFPGTADGNIGGHTLGANIPFNGDIEYFSIRSAIGAGGTVPTAGTIFTFDKRSARHTNGTDILVNSAQTLTRVGSAMSWHGTTPLLQARVAQFVNDIPIEPAVVPSRWSVDLCRSWRRIASVDAYEFEGILRRLETGGWRLKVPAAGIFGGEYAEPRSETPLFTDDFMEPDGPPLAWAPLAGTWAVDTERLKAVTVGGDGYATATRDVELGADQYIEADVVGTVVDGAAVCVRVQNATTYYMGRWDFTGTNFEIYRRVNGVWTQLDATSGAAPTIPFRLRLEVENDTISLYCNEILKCQATDTAISGGGMVGVNCWWVNTMYDNVSAGTIQPAETRAFDPRDVDTIRVVAEGLVAYPGVLIGDDDQLQVIQDKDGEYWEWSGTDCWEYFERRLAYPSPGTEPPWVNSYDNRTGVASTVAAAYVNNNMGPQAIAHRQWGSKLAVVDEEVGPSLSFSARLQTLRQLIIRICKDAGIEAIPSMTFDGQLRILFASARDLSDALVLSDQGDLAESKLTVEKKKATFIISAGTGELNARAFKTANDGSKYHERMEILSDQSSMQNDTELQADAETKLILSAQAFSITSELTSDQAKLALQFGLRLGDQVSVIIKGRRYRLPIEGWSFDITPDHQILRPVFGTAIPNRLAALLRRIDRYNRRQNPDVIS